MRELDERIKSYPTNAQWLSPESNEGFVRKEAIMSFSLKADARPHATESYPAYFTVSEFGFAQT
jgi:hypothetical protein